MPSVHRAAVFDRALCSLYTAAALHSPEDSPSSGFSSQPTGSDIDSLIANLTLPPPPSDPQQVTDEQSSRRLPAEAGGSLTVLLTDVQQSCEQLSTSEQMTEKSQGDAQNATTVEVAALANVCAPDAFYACKFTVRVSCRLLKFA